jgi:hypothetical protein
MLLRMSGEQWIEKHFHFVFRFRFQVGKSTGTVLLKQYSRKMASPTFVT